MSNRSRMESLGRFGGPSEPRVSSRRVDVDDWDSGVGEWGPCLPDDLNPAFSSYEDASNHAKLEAKRLSQYMIVHRDGSRWVVRPAAFKMPATERHSVQPQSNTLNSNPQEIKRQKSSSKKKKSTTSKINQKQQKNIEEENPENQKPISEIEAIVRLNLSCNGTIDFETSRSILATRTKFNFTEEEFDWINDQFKIQNNKRYRPLNLSNALVVYSSTDGQD